MIQNQNRDYFEKWRGQFLTFQEKDKIGPTLNFKVSGKLFKKYLSIKKHKNAQTVKSITKGEREKGKEIRDAKSSDCLHGSLQISAAHENFTKWTTKQSSSRGDRETLTFPSILPKN